MKFQMIYRKIDARLQGRSQLPKDGHLTLGDLYTNQITR
jgi:hypothetical protein